MCDAGAILVQLQRDFRDSPRTYTLPCCSQSHTRRGLGTVHFSVRRRTWPLGTSVFSRFTPNQQARTHIAFDQRRHTRARLCIAPPKLDTFTLLIPPCDPTFVYFKYCLSSTSIRFGHSQPAATHVLLRAWQNSAELSPLLSFHFSNHEPPLSPPAHRRIVMRPQAEPHQLIAVPLHT